MLFLFKVLPKKIKTLSCRLVLMLELVWTVVPVGLNLFELLFALDVVQVIVLIVLNVGYSNARLSNFLAYHKLYDPALFLFCIFQLLALWSPCLCALHWRCFKQLCERLTRWSFYALAQRLAAWCFKPLIRTLSLWGLLNHLGISPFNQTVFQSHCVLIHRGNQYASLLWAWSIIRKIVLFFVYRCCALSVKKRCQKHCATLAMCYM